MRVSSAAAILLLLFFGVSIMVSQNPKSGKAAFSQVRFLDNITVMYDINQGGDGNFSVFAGDDSAKKTKSFLIKNNIICPMIRNYNDGVSVLGCDPAYNGIANAQYAIPFEDDVVFNQSDYGASESGVYYLLGTNHFKSLTVYVASVTHPKLTESDMATDLNSDGSIVDNCAISPSLGGCDKKVDLEIDGKLTLAVGGNIDASGKGYPGSYLTGLNPNGHSGGQAGRIVDGKLFGWGPGGGRGFWQLDYGHGGGGGFGGDGHLSYVGATQGTVGGKSSAYLNGPNDFDFGSGGGSGDYYGKSQGKDDSSTFFGGAGGGRIKIQTGSLVYGSYNNKTGIFANGENGVLKQDDGIDVGAGGGSGGLIVINTKSLQYTGIAVLYGAVTVDTDTIDGHVGVFTSTGFDQNLVFGISSNGGKGFGNNGAGDGPGGGGGYIVVNKTVTQPVTIRKRLEPVVRPANTPNTPNTTFNPYALQKGDVIRVVLDVSNLVPGMLTLEDEMLKVPYSNPFAYCLYIAGTLNPDTVVDTSDYKLVWDYDVLTNETTKSFTYNCEVQ